MEYPVGGAGDYRTPALRLALADGSRSADLRFAGYRLIRGRESLKGLPYVRAGEETETLEIGLRDVAGAFSVLLRYSVWPEEDAVIRSAVKEMKMPCSKLLYLAIYYEKSHEEIASIMHYANARTVTTQRSRCTQKLIGFLRKRFKELGYEY